MNDYVEFVSSILLVLAFVFVITITFSNLSGFGVVEVSLWSVLVTLVVVNRISSLQKNK